MRKMFRRIHYLLNRSRLERELDEEMAAHQEMMPADRRSAFGNTSRLQEEIRDAWGWHWLEDLRHDLVYGARGFVRDRRLTVSVLAAITLAVGAATAVFSVVDRSLFRALPYNESDRLVSVGILMPLWGEGEFMFAGAYRDWTSTQTALDLTSWRGVSTCDLGGDSPQRLGCAKVEATFLSTLGVQPLLGRNFTAEEDRPNGEAVALLSFGLWQTNFGADRRVLGQLITLDGKPVRIVGVLPAAFETPDLTSAQLVVPQKLPRARGRNRPVKVIGRLRPGHTPESAAATLAPLFEVFRTDFGARVGSNFQKTMSLRISTLRDQQIRDYRLALWMLLGAVTAFVLIACSNVANLLLARLAVRRHEFGIRTALGASRARLIRQMLAESGLLALAGGAGGCALAWCLLRVSIALAPDGMLRLQQASLDSRVLGFAVFLSLGAALLFGLAPSLHHLRTDVSGGVWAVGNRRTWLGQTLITAQLSVSLVLLTAASLLLMSLWRLQNAPLGFERERIVTASFTLPQYRYQDEARQQNFFTQLEARLNGIPGVVAAAITDSLPPGGDTRTAPYAALLDPSGSAGETSTEGSVRWRYVTPGYFEALGIPIKRGRVFSDTDRLPGEQQVILSESLSRRGLGEGDAIGKSIGGGWPRLVIGIAGDVRNAGPANSPDPEFYVVRKTSRDGIPGGGGPDWSRRATAIIRSTLSETAAAESLRSTMHELDSTLPVKIETMDSQVDHYYARPRFQTALLSLFAFTGLVLAGIGLYGLISVLVAERTREIGVRIAFGATRSRIARMVIADAARWTGAGAIVGIAASAGLLHLLQGLLYEVKPLDARAFIAAVTVLVAVALLAAWIPARRASRVEPMIALRHE